MSIFPLGGSFSTAHRRLLRACIVLASSLVLVAQPQAQTESTARPAATSGVSRPGTSQLPALGDGSELAISEERRLGDRIAREIFP